MQASESSKPSSMLTSRRFAPPRTWSSATSTAVVMSPALIKLRNFAEPATFVRSPIIWKFDSGRIASGSSPLKYETSSPEKSGTSRGALPSTAFAISRMWSGVVPQQPPTMLTIPEVANSPTNSPVSAGASSYSPNALGRPAFGYAETWVSATRESSAICGRMSTAPREQLTPIEIGFAWAIERQ